MENRVLTVLFADVKEELRADLEQCLETYEGKLQKVIGTACLCLFEQTTKALKAALEFQKRSNQQSRIALTRGEITETGNDIFGEPVNLAARLEGIAPIGEIYVSESVYRTLQPTDTPISELGVHQFKGISQPVHIYRVGEKKKESSLPAPTASLPAEGKELFDFSRVEQERMAEKDALTAGRPQFQMDESIIPLAESVNPRSSRKSNRMTESIPAYDFRAVERKAKLKKGLIILGFGAVGVPAVLVAGVWLFSTAHNKKDDKQVNEVKKGMDQSLLLQSMKAERPRTPLPSDINKGEVYGSLLIETKPPMAEVWVEEKMAAHTTPARIKKVPTGQTLKITVKKQGYEDSIQFLNVAAGEEKEIAVTLHKSK